MFSLLFKGNGLKSLIVHSEILVILSLFAKFNIKKEKEKDFW